MCESKAIIPKHRKCQSTCWKTAKNWMTTSLTQNKSAFLLMRDSASSPQLKPCASEEILKIHRQNGCSWADRDWSHHSVDGFWYLDDQKTLQWQELFLSPQLKAPRNKRRVVHMKTSTWMTFVLEARLHRKQNLVCQNPSMASVVYGSHNMKDATWDVIKLEGHSWALPAKLMQTSVTTK